MKNQSYGFSLIELMVVLTIAAIIAGFAIPNYRTFIQKKQINIIAQEMQNSLQLARTLAITSRENVLLCPGQVAPCASNWHEGWQILGESNQSLAVFMPLPRGYEITWNRTDRGIEWEADGCISGGDNGTFTISSDDNKKYIRKVILSLTGRIRME